MFSSGKKLLSAVFFLIVLLSCGKVSFSDKENKATAVNETVIVEDTASAGLKSQGIAGPTEVFEMPAQKVEWNSENAPISADLSTMLHYPLSRWRNSEYEIFTFNQYPSLLYLITKSFTVQSQFLKRLAFFTEKSGFIGRLARDEEIAGLRDWFAHDYRARDMAAFFELARKQSFPLNESEILLRDLLLAQGIIKNEESRYIEGKGALLGFSVESRDRLPVYFAHETIHGLTFIIPELQKLFVDFFDSLSGIEKDFISDALVYRGYNVLEDRELLAFEMAAYLLQQKPEETDKYFRDYIMGWYAAYHKNNIGEFTAFLATNPGIFGMRSAALQKRFEALTGLSAETFLVSQH